MRKLVTKSFRDLLIQQYPGLKLDISFRRFMRYLIFGRKDILTGLPLIDLFHIAKAQDVVDYYKTSNKFIGQIFLEEFQSKVMTLETFSWSDWSHHNKRARVALITFPEHLLQLMETEIYMTANNMKEKVYFDTGKRVRDNTLKVDRELIKKEALTYFEFAVPEAKPLLQYMNNLHVRNFSTVITNNFDVTLNKVLQISDPLKKRVQTEILYTLQEDLQPFYKPSVRKCTDRIFPCNYSIPMLRRDIRKVLTKGWYEFDLANAQLAIVAKLWNIQSVQDFLKTNTSIWPELFKHYKLNYENLKVNNPSMYHDIKDVLKTSVYSLVFGMSKYNLIKEINQGLEMYNFNKGGYHFFKHPLIKALYQARELKIKEMNELTQAQTIFGITRNIYGSKTTKGTPTQERKDSINSILAHQAQAVELYLLLPVVGVANTTKDFYITLWMHDGFSLHFTDKSKVDYWIKKIQSAVQQKIDEQGILTHLEWELL